MGMIEHLVKVRRDGKRIEANMDAQALPALGWRPDKVVRIEWEAGGQQWARDFAHGVLARVAPDGNAIALIEEAAADGPGLFSIMNADGSTRFEISNTHRVNGVVMSGKFAWFEQALRDPDHAIGVIFQAISATGPEQYQFDLDLATGEVIEARITR